MSNSVVFVNNVRVTFKMLNDGARITLGGVPKSYQQGSRFPPASGPHIVYEYSIAKDQPAPGVYKEPVFRTEDLIKVSEFVGGKYVREFYHTEDFNMTLVPTT